MFNTEPLRRAIEETYLEGEAFVRPEKMAAHNGVRRISRSLSKCYTRQFRTIINRVSIATPRLTVEKWSREGRKRIGFVRIGGNRGFFLDFSQWNG